MSIFALVDCNNFFASCERCFNPSLENKPLVILSSNDGCIIARSNEAKKLGIPMGAPFYAWREFCNKNQVITLSSNFELYSDMSHRIMTALEELCPELEIYSVDEAFLSFDQFSHKNLSAYALHIRKTLKAWTGMPVSIGIAPSKTLAKVANQLAKKHSRQGVFDLCDPQLQDMILDKFPVEDLWGIGRNLAPQLKQLNIYTAKDLRDTDPKMLRKKFSVVMERMIEELNGISCLSLESVEQQHQIQMSRSFGKAVTDLDELEEAVSHYTAKACMRLRQINSLAQGVYVFLHTNLYSKNTPRYSNSGSCYFPQPTSDTRDIISAAKKCLKSLYKPGFGYKKAGVILLNLIPDTVRQADLFSPRNDKKSASLMALTDQLHHRWGQKSLFFCAEGVDHGWVVKCDRRSPRYTTVWDELVKVR